LNLHIAVFGFEIHRRLGPRGLPGSLRSRALFPFGGYDAQDENYGSEWMEDPMKGVLALEFITPCHIDADIRLICAESGTDFSSTLAEGDGRTLIVSQQEVRPAKQSADHLNGENSFGGRWTGFPKRTFHRYKVIPQAGDGAELFPCAVCPASFLGFGATWYG
jgi:hypothetical protein